MQVADIIQCLSAFAPGITPRSEGSDLHVFDGEAGRLEVRQDSGGRTFSLSVPVAQLAEDNFDEIAAQLLAANMACDPHAFALDDQGRVALIQAFSFEQSTVLSLRQALQALSELAAVWRTSIERSPTDARRTRP